MASRTQAGSERQARAGGTVAAIAAAPAPAGGHTSTPDHLYGVVSVLYHALQGAQTYQQYSHDASKANNEELQQFFDNCTAEEEKRAARAKTLLLDLLEDESDAEGNDEDEDDDADEDEDEDEE